MKWKRSKRQKEVPVNSNIWNSINQYKAFVYASIKLKLVTYTAVCCSISITNVIVKSFFSLLILLLLKIVSALSSHTLRSIRNWTHSRHWKTTAETLKNESLVGKKFSGNAIIDWILTIILSLLLFLTPNKLQFTVMWICNDDGGMA